MRIPTLLSRALLLASAAQLGCDEITAGQIKDDPGPPKLAKLLIQDDVPTGGRNVATDLIDQSPPIKCSVREPCPAGDKFSHPPCNLATGFCPNPLSPKEVPPSVGWVVAGSIAGTQIRFVTSKRLDQAVGTVVKNPMTGAVAGYELRDPSLIGVYDAKGVELPSWKYWDPTGVPSNTSDVFINPFGPALVVKPKVPLLPLADYTIRVKPELMKDDKGQAVTVDIYGTPVAASYPFTTEGLQPAGGALTDLAGAIDPKDVLVFKTSVRFVPASLKVTVKKGGVVVPTKEAPEYGTDPKRCTEVAESPLQINIFRVQGLDRADWEVGGDYTVSIEAVAIDNRAAVFSSNGFGKEPFRDFPFKVKSGADKDELYLAKDHYLPWECLGPRPVDLGLVNDLSRVQGPDLKPVDGAPRG